jgi:Tol biopolymer transport system component
MVVRKQARGVVFVMEADGTNLRSLSDKLDVRDGPAWSPDGKWVLVVANDGEAVKLFKVPVDGGQPLTVVSAATTNPVTGRAIHYLSCWERSLCR